MYALIDYNGEQIKIQEGEKVRIPYQKTLKIGSKIEFNQVLFFDDGKTKKIGNPYLKSTSFKAKVDSHIKDSKVIVFKKKRRKGHQKKNGHQQPYTLLVIDKFNSKKTAPKKAAPKKAAPKKSSSKTTKTKKD